MSDLDKVLARADAVGDELVDRDPPRKLARGVVSGDPLGYLRRSDNLLDVGGGLVWEFAPTWTLRPEFLYNNDNSNVPLSRRSYFEAWLNVRKSF